MKLPFQTLAALLLFVGAPIGLMQLTSQAMEQPKTYPLLSTASHPGLATMRAVGRSFGRICEEQGNKIGAFQETFRHSSISSAAANLVQLAKERGLASPPQSVVTPALVADKTTTRDEKIPGLLKSTGLAFRVSWAQWQPTLVALPGRITALNQKARLADLRQQAEIYVATLVPLATRTPLPVEAKVWRSELDVKQLGILTSAIRGFSRDASQLISVSPVNLVPQVFRSLSEPIIRAPQLLEMPQLRAWSYPLLRGIARFSTYNQ